LATLDVIDDPAMSPPMQTIVDSIKTIRPTQGGFLESVAREFGQTVEQDTVLGRVISPYSFEVLEEIQNPVPNGVLLLSHLTRNLVQPGDYGYMVGSPE
jgi:predicted deacylase